jgi:3-hydroxyisobutyrate dehydrogenase-like beta-hydroxyacid dehydrogenase
LAQQSTIIDVVVRTDKEVLECTTGKDGLLEGAKAGTLILLHSTIRPQTTKKVVEAAAQRNVHAIDACMSSVPRAIRAGNLTFLVWGPKDLVDRARPHLLNMAKQVMHMGPLTTGNIAKLIKNMVNGAETLIVQEAIRIGEAGGTPYPEALEMMRQTHSGSFLSHWQDRFDSTGIDTTPKGGGNLFNKDVPLVAELGQNLGVEIPVT